MNKILSGFVFLVLSSMGILQAQNTPSNDSNDSIFSILYRITMPKYTLAIQPLVLINGGLRFDFEKRLSHSTDWLQLGITGYYLPQLSMREDNTYILGTNEEEIKGLKGVGFNGSYKHLISPESKSFYIMGDLNYTFSQVNYAEYDYHSFIEDGMNFYEYNGIMQAQTFNKVGISTIIGLQTPLKNKFFIDAYAGIGYVYSFYDENKAHFDKSSFDYGGRGIVFVGGVRLGIAFGK